MRTRAAVSVVVWLAFATAGTVRAEPLAFAGFDRSMDIGVWIDR